MVCAHHPKREPVPRLPRPYRVRELREGKLYDAKWGVRGRGTGIFADQMEALFDVTCRKLGLNEEDRELSTAAFRRPTAQASLF